MFSSKYIEQRIDKANLLKEDGRNPYENVVSRDCYTLNIKTYTSGTKELEFKSHDGNKNKQEAYKLLDYIDDEMDKLV